jgi:adenosylhomocysteine nucleosidase
MKIGIIGAMQEEISYLQKQMQNYSKQVIAGCEFFVGSLQNKEVVLLKSGIGKVSAALATTLMCQLFKPDYIINTGCAGGFADGLQVGDIVIGVEVKFCDVDVTVFGYEFGQAPNQPVAYKSDDFLINLAKKCNPKIKQGLIVSGDAFIHTDQQIKFIREKFSNVKAVDMESSAIAQVCYNFNIPFLSIRAISDIVHHQESVSIYDQSLEKVFEYVADLVLAILAAEGGHVP